MESLFHDEYHKIVIKLRKARDEAKKTQNDVAEELNKLFPKKDEQDEQEVKITQSDMSRIEKGIHKVDPIELKYFAQIYNKPISYFIGERVSFFPDEYQKIVIKLSNARDEAGKTQMDVVEELNKLFPKKDGQEVKITQSHMSMIEEGILRIDPVELKYFAQIYNKPISYFTDVLNKNDQGRDNSTANNKLNRNDPNRNNAHKSNSQAQPK